MNVTILCGATKEVAVPFGLDEAAYRAERDRLLYHDGDYGSTIGMPYEDEDGEVHYACVGCWWCEGPPTEAHGWML